MVGCERGDAAAEGRERGGDRHPGGQHDGQQPSHGMPCPLSLLLAERTVIYLVGLIDKTVTATLVFVSDDRAEFQTFLLGSSVSNSLYGFS